MAAVMAIAVAGCGSLSDPHRQTHRQALLDHARLAKVSGDGRADAGARVADYRSAAATLGTLAQSAQAPSDLGLSRTDVYRITTVATNARAILSQTGLP